MSCIILTLVPELDRDYMNSIIKASKLVSFLLWHNIELRFLNNMSSLRVHTTASVWLFIWKFTDIPNALGPIWSH